jgi:hypothetical protein
MFSNVALSHEGKFGETTSIIDRCIFESAIKVTWLCENPTVENFIRFLADGLKTELEFKEEIEANIKARNGIILPVEERMLRSVGNHLAAADLTATDIIAAKKMPDVASLMASLGLARLQYVVAQRIGSHHVHGTWPSLLFHYLEKQTTDVLNFEPRGHNCETHMNQYMYVCLLTLSALRAYVGYALDDAAAETFVGLFTSTEEEIMRVYTEALGGDLSN